MDEPDRQPEPMVILHTTTGEVRCRRCGQELEPYRPVICAHRCPPDENARSDGTRRPADGGDSTS